MATKKASVPKDEQLEIVSGNQVLFDSGCSLSIIPNTVSTDFNEPPLKFLTSRTAYLKQKEKKKQQVIT